MPVDLLQLAGAAAEVLEALGYVAVARKRDGVVTLEYRRLVGSRQYMMRHVVTDDSPGAPELAARCDAEFRAAMAHHE